MQFANSKPNCEASYNDMMISNQLLHELQEIMKKDYHIELDHDQAAEFAKMLLTYFRTLIQIENENQSLEGGDQ